MNLSRIKKLLFLHISRLPMCGHVIRPFIVKMAGVHILDYKSTFIGEGVVFDSVHPDKIIISGGARITMHTIILTHYLNLLTNRYTSGTVSIGQDAFIGANVLIVKPITIGKRAVVGAGSVVTKDIPDYEIWAGNPAKFIRKIDI